MPTSGYRTFASGVALLLSAAKLGLAQNAPPPPPQPVAPPIEASGPVDQPMHVIPTPPVIIVPPEGIQPTWNGRTIDPIALERKQPKHVEKKARSWFWRRSQGKILGYPEEFTPRPLGSAVHDHARVMVANGAAGRLALFDYDFVQGSHQLTTRGRDQLAKVAAQLAVSPYPLVIERTPGAPALAEARRNAVLNELAANRNPVDPSRVLVGLPVPTGMSGVEAQVISANQLNRTQQYGPTVPINSNGLNSPSGVTNNISGTLPGQ